MTGVYMIYNKNTGKYYIGSSINIGRRVKTHKYQLKNGNHNNVHLQNSWNKYGESAFEFIILEECDKLNVRSREEFYITIGDACNHAHGYNILPNTNIGLGVMASNEVKEKISKATSGCLNGNYGRKHTEEELKIMHDNRWGANYIKVPRKKSPYKSQVRYSPEERSQRAKDRVTDITRLKISKSKVGKTFSKEVIDKFKQQRAGENNANCKLSKNDVLEIYTLMLNGTTCKEICSKFCISQSLAYKIKRKEHWVFKNDK